MQCHTHSLPLHHQNSATSFQPLNYQTYYALCFPPLSNQGTKVCVCLYVCTWHHARSPPLGDHILDTSGAGGGVDSSVSSIFTATGGFFLGLPFRLTGGVGLAGDFGSLSNGGTLETSWADPVIDGSTTLRLSAWLSLLFFAARAIAPSCLSSSESPPTQAAQGQSLGCSWNNPMAMNSFKHLPRSRMLLFQSLELFLPEMAWNSLGVTHRSLKRMHFPLLPLEKRFMYSLASFLAQLMSKYLHEYTQEHKGFNYCKYSQMEVQQISTGILAVSRCHIGLYWWVLVTIGWLWTPLTCLQHLHAVITCTLVIWSVHVMFITKCNLGNIKRDRKWPLEYYDTWSSIPLLQRFMVTL